MRKILIVAVAVLLVGAGAYAAFLRGGAATPAQVAPTAPVVAEADELVAEAKAVPVHNVALSLPTSGIIAEVLVAEGDQVQAGQTLLRLDQNRAAATVAQAEAQVAHADPYEAVPRKTIAE